MKKASTTTLCQCRKRRDRQLTIGLYVGDWSSFYCVLNKAGEVILASSSSCPISFLAAVLTSPRRQRSSIPSIWTSK
jgi:hypothetical protein